MTRSAARHPRLAVAALLLACAPAAAAATVGSPLAGTYQTKITGTGSALIDASWQLAIASRGTYALTRNGAPAAHGHTTVRRGSVVFTDDGGPLACKGDQRSGTYGWALQRVSGQRYLVLHVKRDPCAGRRLVLARPLLRH